MLSNAYFLAKFRFDTAENEPAKNLQKKLRNLPILLILRRRPPRGPRSASPWGRARSASPGRRRAARPRAGHRPWVYRAGKFLTGIPVREIPVYRYVIFSYRYLPLVKKYRKNWINCISIFGQNSANSDKMPANFRQNLTKRLQN